MYFINANAVLLSVKDFKTGDDFIFAIWLFALPIILDSLTIGLPLFFLLKRVEIKNKVTFYMVILFLFLMDYMISAHLYAVEYAKIKFVLNLLICPFFLKKNM